MLSLKAVGEDFPWLLVDLGIPWSIDVSLQSLPLKSHGILASCVCVSFLLLPRIPVT